MVKADGNKTDVLQKQLKKRSKGEVFGMRGTAKSDELYVWSTYQHTVQKSYTHAHMVVFTNSWMVRGRISECERVHQKRRLASMEGGERECVECKRVHKSER